MPSLLGNLLSSAATSYNDYQTQQEQNAYTRQQQAQSLAAGALANQSKTLDIQAQQNAITQDQAQTGFLTGAAQDVYGGGAPSGANGLASQAQPQGIAGQIAQPNQNGASQPLGAPQMTAPTGGLPATQNGQVGGKPLTPLQQSVMTSESNGQAAATSPVGATGTMQTMPGTLTNPGFGVRPAQNPNDPSEKQRVGVDYLGAMQQRYGNDADALTAYNWGPANTDKWIASGRKLDQLPPATANYVKTTLGRLQGQQQQGQQNQQQDQQLAAPSPAESLKGRVDAGVQVRPDEYQESARATFKQASMYQDAAQKAYEKGNVKAGLAFTEKAQALVGQALNTQKEGFAVQKDANKETAELANGVKDQSSYNNFQEQIRNNPAMQRAVAGLNLTGDYDLDRNKMATLADRSETLKNQHANDIRKQEFALKQQIADRAEKKGQAQDVRISTAQVADQSREQALAQKGIPFAPSLAATLPKGTTPAVAQKAQQAVQKVRTDYLNKDVQGSQAAKQVQDYAKQILGLLDGPDKVTTGGATRIPGIGAAFNMFESNRQLFDKIGNQLVSAAASANGANGGGRSAFTAAMYDRLKTQKPNLDLNADVNKSIALEYYNAQAIEQNMRTFTHEYLQANPDATPQAAQLQWASYEQSLGPIGYVDPDAPNGYRPNTAGVPTLPDGRKNPEYKDYHDFFKGQQ